MYIVHVVRQFHPAVGGIESVVQELASAQVAARHQVRIITLNRLFKTTRESVLDARDVIDGAEVIRIPFLGSLRYPLAPAAIKFIKDADIVHVHAIDFFFDYLAWSKPLHRKKLVVSTHGGFFHTPYAARLKRLYFFIITRMSLAWYDGVVAVSDSDQELFCRIRKRGIVCIENGVDISKYANASAAVPVKAILALGRLASNKRLDRLISFIAALRRRDPEWKLTIAGYPWDIDVADLTARAEAQHIRDAVEIVVAPSQEAIRELMGHCSVIASASEYEGFGLAAIEGMSAGLFPLLSDIPTFRRLITRAGVGILVDFSDAEAAADRVIGEWQTIEADYCHYRRSSIAAVSAYDWQSVSQKYERLYEYVCGAKTRCSPPV
jgi:alpha-1,3-mannosyltransferase